MDEKLKKQLDFIYEVDKVKAIFRHTKLFDNSRYENDAEHSWHIAMMAIILSEYANEEIELAKVLKMVLIHDLVEIDAGDYIVYTDKVEEKAEKEMEAAKRIFAILPEEQGKELLELWQEFEKRETPEARFAAAIDRLEPLMQNYYTEGHAWKKHNICSKDILKANKHISEGSEKLWEYAEGMIRECVDKGLIK
ncbi:HD domain-containing protein [Natronospora cellulosivora (SeqCode)]